MLESVAPSPEIVRTQVWQVYDLYRTALLNVKYAGDRLATAKRWERGVSIFIAGTTSVAVGTWAIWRTPEGETAWAVLSAAGAVAAILHTMLHLSDQVERYARLWATTTALYYDLHALVERIAVAQTFTPAMAADYERIRARFRDAMHDDDPSPDDQRVLKYQAAVERQIASERLWQPAA